MKRISATWRAATRAERALLALVATTVSATVVLAAVAQIKRPADISNPDAAFEKPGRVDQKQVRREHGKQVNWPRFGYDLQRTKSLNVQRVKPPFGKIWKYDQDQLIEFAPIVVGKRLYAIDNDGVFLALNKDTGKVVWRKQLGSLNASSPAYENGVLYAVNLEPSQALAIRARDGKVLWRKDLPGRAESSPLVIRGKVYFGTEPGELFAVRAKDGKTIWTTQLGGAIKAAPAFAQGTIFVGDYGGQFSAVRATDGEIRWQSDDLGAGLGQSGRFYSTPAVAFGRVYVGNVDGRVYSFDQKTGEIAWTFSAGDYVYSGIAAADTKGTRPAVYFGSHDRSAYALDAKSGKLIWKESPGGQVSGPATVVGDVAYVSTFSGNSTVGFDLKTGQRVFKFDEGEYGPVVSDGQRLYLTGGSTIVGFEPVKLDKYKRKKGTRGILTPAQMRKAKRIQRKARERRAGERQGEPERDGEQGPGAAEADDEES